MVAPDRDKLRRSFRVATRASDGTAPRDTASSDTAPGDTAPGAAVPRGEALRAFLQQRRHGLRGERPRVALPRVTLPPGHEEATPHGVLWRRELRYPATFVHGAVPLAAGRRLDGARLAVLSKDPSMAQLDATQCLFLDTETTGLHGGAGTVVFAYGLAFFERDELVLEQTFLRAFGEEPAMLRHLARRLSQFPVPVTFVGKSFDRHRIQARLAIHKLEAPVLSPRHLDLFHLVRRAYGKVLPDTRLRTVEQRLLGLHRQDDLPGSEAPAAFLDWIRDGTGPVDRVLEHNRLDVLSLAALLGVLAGAGST